MENYVLYLIALPLVWFVFTITFEFMKLMYLWINLKISEIKRRFQ